MSVTVGMERIYFGGEWEWGLYCTGTGGDVNESLWDSWGWKQNPRGGCNFVPVHISNC